MWNTGLLVVLLAGVEDTDRAQELVQLAWSLIISSLRGDTIVELLTDYGAFC